MLQVQNVRRHEISIACSQKAKEIIARSNRWRESLKKNNSFKPFFDPMIEEEKITDWKVRRKTPRVTTVFDAEMILPPVEEEGDERRFSILSIEVSQYGASFFIDGHKSVWDEIAVGTKLKIETSMNLLDAEVNGKWQDDKERNCFGVRLLSGRSWID